MGSAAPWLSDDEEVAWRAFRRMTIAVQAGVVHDLAASGLSETDYEVLSTLVETPEMTSTLHAQAQKMGWSRSRLSRHAGRMEARELIRRDPDPADGRGCLLVLAPSVSTPFEQRLPCTWNPCAVASPIGSTRATSLTSCESLESSRMPQSRIYET